MHARVPPLWATPKHARTADAPRTTGDKWRSSKRHNRRVTGVHLAALTPCGSPGRPSAPSRHRRRGCRRRARPSSAGGRGCRGKGSVGVEEGTLPSLQAWTGQRTVCRCVQAPVVALSARRMQKQASPCTRAEAGTGVRSHLLLAGLAALRAHVVVGGVGVAAVLGRHLGGMLSGSQRVGGRY